MDGSENKLQHQADEGKSELAFSHEQVLNQRVHLTSHKVNYFDWDKLAECFVQCSIQCHNESLKQAFLLTLHLL